MVNGSNYYCYYYPTQWVRKQSSYLFADKANAYVTQKPRIASIAFQEWPTSLAKVQNMSIHFFNCLISIIWCYFLCQKMLATMYHLVIWKQKNQQPQSKEKAQHWTSLRFLDFGFLVSEYPYLFRELNIPTVCWCHINLMLPTFALFFLLLPLIWRTCLLWKQKKKKEKRLPCVFYSVNSKLMPCVGLLCI